MKPCIFYHLGSDAGPMPPHVLGNKRRVAGEQQQYWRNAWTCSDLSSLENLVAPRGATRLRVEKDMTSVSSRFNLGC